MMTMNYQRSGWPSLFSPITRFYSMIVIYYTNLSAQSEMFKISGLDDIAVTNRSMEQALPHTYLRFQQPIQCRHSMRATGWNSANAIQGN